MSNILSNWEKREHRLSSECSEIWGIPASGDGMEKKDKKYAGTILREDTEKTVGITKLKTHNVVWHNEYSEVLHHEYHGLYTLLNPHSEPNKLSIRKY